MITVPEALDAVLAAAVPLEPEEAPLERALGRALAGDILATGDLPPFDRSAMDGYALRAEDAGSPGAVLDVIGEIAAGQPAEPSVGPGQAVRIMTGAPVPPGADAVQMIEQTEPLEGGRRVRILRPVGRGEHVRRRGEDLRKGERILRAGAPVRPAEIALLASLGIVKAPVRRAPRVSFLSTGDEIVPPERTPLPHQIRNSNAPLLSAMLAGLGLPFEPLGIVPDEPEALARALRRGLDSDVLCVTGGVSVGAYDLVARALSAEGVETLFHGVSVRPGKPLLFGRRGRSLVFGLPGNPVSVATTFALFVVPALRRLLGHAEARDEEVTGRLEEEIRQKPGREYYCLVEARFREGAYRVRPVPTMGSGDLAAPCRANAFAIVPAEAERLPAGSEVRLLLWGKT